MRKLNKVDKNPFGWEPNKLAAHYSKRALLRWLKKAQKYKTLITPDMRKKIGAVRIALLFIDSQNTIEQNKALLKQPPQKSE